MEPLFGMGPMMFFSTFYPKSREVEITLKLGSWWYFRLRVMRACIKRLAMGIKRGLVRFTRVGDSSAYMVVKVRKSILRKSIFGSSGEITNSI